MDLAFVTCEDFILESGGYIRGGHSIVLYLQTDHHAFESHHFENRAAGRAQSFQIALLIRRDI